MRFAQAFGAAQLMYPNSYLLHRLLTPPYLLLDWDVVDDVGCVFSNERGQDAPVKGCKRSLIPMAEMKEVSIRRLCGGNR